jgi:hypothetical protein
MAKNTSCVLLTSFVEAIHVELNKLLFYLSDEAVDVTMAEVFR